MSERLEGRHLQALVSISTDLGRAAPEIAQKPKVLTSSPEAGPSRVRAHSKGPLVMSVSLEGACSDVGQGGRGRVVMSEGGVR
jgi:hypothetical protein